MCLCCQLFHVLPPPLPGLPAPNITTTVHSSAGSGEDDCIGVGFSGETDSLLCEVGVVNNLGATPTIRWLKGTSQVVSTSGSMLVYELAPSEEGTFTCEACVTVEAANIADHCSQRAVEITREGVCEYMCLKWRNEILACGQHYVHVSVGRICVCTHICLTTGYRAHLELGKG